SRERHIEDCPPLGTERHDLGVAEDLIAVVDTITAEDIERRRHCLCGRCVLAGMSSPEKALFAGQPESFGEFLRQARKFIEVEADADDIGAWMGDNGLNHLYCHFCSVLPDDSSDGTAVDSHLVTSPRETVGAASGHGRRVYAGLPVHCRAECEFCITYSAVAPSVCQRLEDDASEVLAFSKTGRDQFIDTQQRKPRSAGALLLRRIGVDAGIQLRSRQRQFYAVRTSQLSQRLGPNGPRQV